MTDTETTKDRLVAAASEVFAEKGYRDATIAGICEAADANIAAVNYHFGDKENLYDKVWRHAFTTASSAYPFDGNLPPHPSAEDALYGCASAILHRIFAEDENGIFAKLLYHEMASPTLALDRIAKEVLFPQSQYLGNVIREFMGKAIGDDVLQNCKHSIVGQCAFFNFSRPLRERVMGKKTMTEEEMEQTARHIARFSLGGLQAIKDSL